MQEFSDIVTLSGKAEVSQKPIVTITRSFQ